MAAHPFPPSAKPIGNSCFFFGTDAINTILAHPENVSHTPHPLPAIPDPSPVSHSHQFWEIFKFQKSMWRTDSKNLFRVRNNSDWFSSFPPTPFVSPLSHSPSACSHTFSISFNPSVSQFVRSDQTLQNLQMMQNQRRKCQKIFQLVL